MQTTGVSGALAPSSTSPGASSVTSADAFLQVLVAELSHQDPTNALDPAQLVAQLAQLTTVEQLQQVRETQAWETAVLLLGRQVTGLDPATGGTVSGTVFGILRGAGGPELQVGGSSIPLANVTSIP